MNETTTQAVFKQAGLAAVLKYHQLVVQPNQRDYSWGESYVKKLFKDLAKAISDGEQTYFLGTVVTIPRPEGTLEVVDGQQRLATTAILLFVMVRDVGIRQNQHTLSASNLNRCPVWRFKRDRHCCCLHGASTPAGTR